MVFNTLHQENVLLYQKKSLRQRRKDLRAEDRARTGHLDLGKVALYQMSYFRIFIQL